jgi:ABC-type transporter Mla subunit MlaD
LKDSAGTTFSQEFVAFQKQFIALLANAPTALDTVTSVAPQLQQDLINTSALLQVLAQQKTGLDTLFQSGSTAVTQVDQLVTSQSANLGCVFHDSAGVLSNLAQSTNLTNLSQGLAENQFFFGAINRVAAPGLANATTNGGASNPSQLFLRTRLEIPPIISPAASTYASPNEIPDVLPGPDASRSMATGSGRRRRPGSCPPPGVRWSPRRPRRPTSSSTARPPLPAAPPTSSRPRICGLCWPWGSFWGRRSCWHGGPDRPVDGPDADDEAPEPVVKRTWRRSEPYGSPWCLVLLRGGSPDG